MVYGCPLLLMLILIIHPSTPAPSSWEIAPQFNQSHRQKPANPLWYSAFLLLSLRSLVFIWVPWTNPQLPLLFLLLFILQMLSGGDLLIILSLLFSWAKHALIFSFHQSVLSVPFILLWALLWTLFLFINSIFQSPRAIVANSSSGSTLTDTQQTQAIISHLVQWLTTFSG